MVVGVGIKPPRGLRNNNPLNIEHQPTNKWLGLDDPPSDGRFARFVSMDYGIRAAALLLMKYYDDYGLKTVKGIVAKWAPAHENNVSNYVATVVTRMGVAADAEINLHNREVMRRLVSAMALVETGVPVDDIALERGLTLAGFADKTENVMSTKTVVAAATTAAPAVIATGLAIVDAITPHTDVLGGVATAFGGPIAGTAVVGGLTLISALANIINRVMTRNRTGV